MDKETLVNKIFNFRSDRVTPMMFEFNLAEQAQKHRMRIVLPEGRNCGFCAPPSPCASVGLRISSCLAIPTHPGEDQEVWPQAAGCHDYPAYSLPAFHAYAQQYYEMRKSKGLTLEQAQERMQDSTYFGTMMVQIGDATAWFPAL